jgi:choline dehydrogenase-like flavoprotein
MSEEIKADFCIVGAGIAGALVASRPTRTGKNIVILDQGPCCTEADRINMLMQAREALKDFADFNDAADAALIPRTGMPYDVKTPTDVFLRLCPFLAFHRSRSLSPFFFAGENCKRAGCHGFRIFPRMMTAMNLVTGQLKEGWPRGTLGRGTSRPIDL